VVFRVTTYLEMMEPGAHRRKTCADPAFAVREVRDWTVNREMNELVGMAWRWPMSWDDEKWKAWTAEQSVRTKVAYLGAERVGYYELEKHEPGDVELIRFGLLPAFFGRGLGGPLLSAAIDDAWGWGATRVWFHTCTLDHPSALPNYLARGFLIYKRVEEDV
jgi:GNAT superfamily N-acetyltransferase